MRRFTLWLLISAAALLPISASADNGVWTEREICRAALKTYFFLRSKPADTEDRGGFHGFRSASGYVYTCRIDGTRIEFQWVNASGTTKKSNSTTFRVSDDILFVQTDMKEERFLLN